MRTIALFISAGIFILAGIVAPSLGFAAPSTIFPPVGCSPTRPLMAWDGTGNTYCLAIPVCAAGEVLTSYAPGQLSCVAIAITPADTAPSEEEPPADTGSCTPVDRIIQRSACSKTCGGGTQSIKYSDGCGDIWTKTQSCNTQACPVTQPSIALPVAVGGGTCSPYTCSVTGTYGCGTDNPNDPSSPQRTGGACPFTWIFWGAGQSGTATGSVCSKGTVSNWTGTSFECIE